MESFPGELNNKYLKNNGVIDVLQNSNKFSWNQTE